MSDAKWQIVEKLLTLRRDCPHTWRCSGNYYDLAEQFGIPNYVIDPVRDEMVNREMEKYLAGARR